jgi:hypothetical protein
MATENIPRKPRISGKAFRLSKTSKRALALRPFRDAEHRAHYRRCMIEAQVAASVIVKREKKEFGASAQSE